LLDTRRTFRLTDGYRFDLKQSALGQRGHLDGYRPALTSKQMM